MATSDSQEITFRWQSVDVVCRQGNHQLQILNNVSGVAKPGRFLAILGSSGSGKTTLLNVLTFRSSSQLDISGTIAANNRTVHGEGITKLSAYVQQNDVFFGILTAREHLWLQAMLRIDSRVSKAEKEKRVDDVMMEIGLAHRQDCLIGNTETSKTLSGGERKRLSLAAEILSDPSLLFCDEPTSGLDSFMAENVAIKLKDIAKKGKTVVCVIHQPSSEIFDLFDDLLLMANGRTAYLGPAVEAKDYFTNLQLPCPPHCNLAEYFLRLLSVAPARRQESYQQIQAICDHYDSKAETLSNQADDLSKFKIDEWFHQPESKLISKHPGFFQQLRYVGWRSFVVEFRDRHLLLSKTCPSIAVSIFLGLVYFMQENNQRGTENLNGAMFMVIALATFSIGFCLIASFPLEFPTVKRDIENGTYSALVYYLSKTAAETVIFTILSIVMGTIIYWMVGLRNDGDNFIVFLLTFVLVTYVIIGYAYTISCAIGDVQTAPSFFGPLIVPAITFGGFVLNDASIPKYFVWLEYLSWFKYANSIFMVNQWSGFGTIDCEYEISIPPIESTRSVTMAPGSLPMQGTNYSSNYIFSSVSLPDHNNLALHALAASRCYKNGEQVLLSRNYSSDDNVRDFLGLAGLLISLRITAYLCLYFRMHGLPWFLRNIKMDSFMKPEYGPLLDSESVC